MLLLDSLNELNLFVSGVEPYFIQTQMTKRQARLSFFKALVELYHFIGFVRRFPSIRKLMGHINYSYRHAI